MRSLDDGYGVRTVTYESGIRMIVAGDERKPLGICLNCGGLINLVPIFSPTGRMFFNTSLNSEMAPNRYYFIPSRAQIASRVCDYCVHETDSPEYLVLDLSKVKDREVVLRVPSEITPKDSVGTLYVIDLANDDVAIYTEIVKYDQHLCEIADSLENQPVPGYEGDYSFSKEDWQELTVEHFYAFPSLSGTGDSSAANNSTDEEPEDEDDFTADDLNP